MEVLVINDFRLNAALSTLFSGGVSCENKSR